jgi:hypothetical protein
MPRGMPHLWFGVWGAAGVTSVIRMGGNSPHPACTHLIRSSAPLKQGGRVVTM